MMVKNEIIEKYVGQPYKHNGRNEYLDCLGLIISFLSEHGIKLPEDDGRVIEKEWYKKDPRRLIRGLKEYAAVNIPANKLRPLDVVVFEFEGIPRHMGVMISRSKFIHARENKKVAVIRLKHYKRFLHSCWRVKGGEIDE
ncbi:MAG: NlpC/P60 family protein [bacterium]